MNPTSVAWAIRFFITFFGGVSLVACGPSQQPRSMEELEQAYQEVLNGKQEVDLDSLKIIVDKLGTKYLEIVSEDSLSEKAPRYLFKAATLYEPSFMNPNRALYLYNRLLAGYPTSSWVPEALFKTGFIYHNTLQDLPRAKETFETFLERYPDHQLAVSAQSEIENLGISPDSILRRIQEENSLQE